MKLECCNNNPVISCKELGTLENPAVLEDPLTSTNEDVINFLCYASSIAIPSSAVQLWSKTCNSLPSRVCKIQERAVGVPGTRAMGSNTSLIASTFSVSDSIEVAHENKCVPAVALIQYRVKFGVEHLISPTHFCKSRHYNKKQSPRCASASIALYTHQLE